MKNVVTMTKTIVGDKTFYNFYLFGVLVRNVSQKEYMKLYYSAREYCRANDIEIKEYVKEEKKDVKKPTSKAK